MEVDIGLLITYICMLATGTEGIINYALNKPAVQKNTYPHPDNDRAASLGTDGITTCDVDFTGTYHGSNNYWYVDLQTRLEIAYLILTVPNATHMVTEDRWENLHVGISDNFDPANLVPGKDFKMCYLFETTPPIGSANNITCDVGPIIGRYVIMFDVDSELNLCEVEVYGKETNNSQCEGRSYSKYLSDVTYSQHILTTMNTQDIVRCLTLCNQHAECVAISFYGNSCQMNYLLPRYTDGLNLYQDHPGAMVYTVSNYCK